MSVTSNAHALDGASFELGVGPELPPGQPPQEIWDISITPVFRLERTNPGINFVELRLAYRL